MWPICFVLEPDTVRSLQGHQCEEESCEKTADTLRVRVKGFADTEKSTVVAVRGHPQVVNLPLAGVPAIRCQDIRPTFATRLVRADVDNFSIQHLLGHSKTTMTACYAHSLADVKMSAVCKLDLAGACPAANSNRTSNSADIRAESAGNCLAA